MMQFNEEAFWLFFLMSFCKKSCSSDLAIIQSDMNTNIRTLASGSEKPDFSDL